MWRFSKVQYIYFKISNNNIIVIIRLLRVFFFFLIIHTLLREGCEKTFLKEGESERNSCSSKDGLMVFCNYSGWCSFCFFFPSFFEAYEIRSIEWKFFNYCVCILVITCEVWEDVSSYEGPDDRIVRNFFHILCTWMVLRPYVCGSVELVHPIVQISIDIRASDSGMVSHLCVSFDEL